jgi:hypothetical protein
MHARPDQDRRRPTYLRIYPPPEDAPPPPLRRRGTRWTIDGWPATVRLYPPSDKRPTRRAQLDPSGIWVELILDP